jgi:hypothetical protein
MLNFGLKDSDFVLGQYINNVYKLPKKPLGIFSTVPVQVLVHTSWIGHINIDRQITLQEINWTKPSGEWKGNRIDARD